VCRSIAPDRTEMKHHCFFGSKPRFSWQLIGLQILANDICGPSELQLIHQKKFKKAFDITARCAIIQQ
jgi:hypothetical protein